MLRVKYADIEVRLDCDPEPGLADNGDLELDLTDLLQLAGQAARGAESALVLCIEPDRSKGFSSQFMLE